MRLRKMESQLAAIFITAILNLVTAQAPNGFHQPTSFRRSSFIDNGPPNQHLGPQNHLNSKIWKQHNFVYSSNNHIPQISRTSGVNYRIGNGIEYFRPKYQVDNEVKVLGRNVPSVKSYRLLDQFHPKLWNGHRAAYTSKYFYSPEGKIEQENGFYQPLLQNSDVGIIYNHKNGGSGDANSKYFDYQPQVDLESNNKMSQELLNFNKPGLMHLNHNQINNYKNVEDAKHWQNNVVKHISRSSYQVQHMQNHSLSEGRIKLPNALHKRVQLQHSNLRPSLTPEDFVGIPPNNETPKRQHINTNINERKESLLSIGEPEPYDSIRLNFPLHTDSPANIKHKLRTSEARLFKNQNFITKLKSNNNKFAQNVVDKNEDIVTQFIITRFTPEEIKYLISFAKTNEEYDKVRMALNNYKVITHALLDFVHYANPLTGYIQNLKIISENKQPGSDVSTSTMEEVITGGESENVLTVDSNDNEPKKLSPGNFERSSINVEDVAKLYENRDSGHENMIHNNIDFHMIHNHRRFLKPDVYENIESGPQVQKPDTNDYMRSVPKIQKPEINENIDEVQKSDITEIIEDAPKVQKPDGNIVPEVWKPELGEVVSTVHIQENKGNIEGVPSDNHVIVDENGFIEINHTRNESSGNTHDDGVMNTQEKIKNLNKTDLEQFMRNLQIYKRIKDAFCDELNTEQAVNVMESVLLSFIEDLLYRYDSEVIFNTAEYSVNRNLHAQRDNQDCYYY